MIALDARLEGIYEAIGHCECLVDIGSDHALIPVALLLSGRIKRAFACDINAGPLERSRCNALKYGVTDIEFLLSDGFEKLTAGSYDKVSICGMGGTLIAEIIDKGGEKAYCELILQPMTAQEELRAYLWENGYRIKQERFVSNSGKPYVILSAMFTGAKEEYGYCDLYLGKVRPQTPEYKLFCKKVRVRAEKRLKGALHGGMPTEDLKKLITECSVQI